MRLHLKSQALKSGFWPPYTVSRIKVKKRWVVSLELTTPATLRTLWHDQSEIENVATAIVSDNVKIDFASNDFLKIDLSAKQACPEQWSRTTLPSGATIMLLPSVIPPESLRSSSQSSETSAKNETAAFVSDLAHAGAPDFPRVSTVGGQQRAEHPGRRKMLGDTTAYGFSQQNGAADAPDFGVRNPCMVNPSPRTQTQSAFAACGDEFAMSEDADQCADQTVVQ